MLAKLEDASQIVMSGFGPQQDLKVSTLSPGTPGYGYRQLDFNHLIMYTMNEEFDSL